MRGQPVPLDVCTVASCVLAILQLNNSWVKTWECCLYMLQLFRGTILKFGGKFGWKMNWVWFFGRCRKKLFFPQNSMVLEVSCIGHTHMLNRMLRVFFFYSIIKGFTICLSFIHTHTHSQSQTDRWWRCLSLTVRTYLGFSAMCKDTCGQENH